MKDTVSLIIEIIGDILIVLVGVAALAGISWVITIGIVKLVTLCFGWQFALLPATGVWIIALAVKLFLLDFDKSK